MTFNTLLDADRLADLALSMLAEFTESRRGHLLLFDDLGRIRHRFGIEVGEEVRSLALAAAEEERLRSLGGDEGARESGGGRALTVPLVCEEARVGAILLERDGGDRGYQASDRALIEACAAHLAQSLRSRQLYESHMAQRRRVELLDRVTRAVNSPNDLEEILNIVVRTASEALSAGSGALILGDTAGRLGVASSYRLRVDPVDSQARPAESRMVRWVFTEGTPFCDGQSIVAPVKQVLRDKRVFDERRRSLHSSAFVRTLGVLYLEGPMQRAPFTEDDLMTLGVFGDHIAAAVANNSLLQQASTDSLTHLDSRRQLETRLGEEIEFARRHGVPLSLIMADVDDFKRINDGHGHQVGDEVRERPPPGGRGALHARAHPRHGQPRRRGVPPPRRHARGPPAQGRQGALRGEGGREELHEDGDAGVSGAVRPVSPSPPGSLSASTGRSGSGREGMPPFDGSRRPA
jgi:GAF domain-containing protein